MNIEMIEKTVNMVVEALTEFFQLYLGYLSSPIGDIPLWVLVFTAVLMYAVITLPRSMSRAMVMLRELSKCVDRAVDRANRSINWLWRKLFKKVTPPEGYTFTGKYILDSQGRKMPELKKL